MSTLPLLPDTAGAPETSVAAAPREEAGLARYARPELATSFAVPIDQIERTIAEVWQQMLGIDAIGRDDNFFDLGGHSLLVVQVHARLTAALARDLPVTDLFQCPTIAALAAHLGGSASPSDPPAPAGSSAPSATPSPSSA